MKQSPQGFTTPIAAIVFLSGVQMVFLGVIGEYLGRACEEVKGRPLYIVSSVVRGGQMDREYVRVYSELYERHWWWRARETLLLDLIRRRCPEGGYGSILDIGCGNGLFFGKLREFGEPEGVEADPAWREFGRPSPAQVHYRVFDSTFQPEKRYGLILMLDLIEHLDDPAGALHHAVNLLTGDGKLIVTVPAFLQLWTSHDDLNHHVTRFTRGSFLPIARQAGMSIETMRYFFHWLFFAKAAVRLKESLAKPARPETPGIPRHGSMAY